MNNCIVDKNQNYAVCAINVMNLVVLVLVGFLFLPFFYIFWAVSKPLIMYGNLFSNYSILNFYQAIQFTAHFGNRLLC